MNICINYSYSNYKTVYEINCNEWPKKNIFYAQLITASYPFFTISKIVVPQINKVGIRYRNAVCGNCENFSFY